MNTPEYPDQPTDVLRPRPNPPRAGGAFALIAAAAAIGGGVPMLAGPRTQVPKEHAWSVRISRAEVKRQRKALARATLAVHAQDGRSEAAYRQVMTNKPARKPKPLSTHAEKRARRRALRAFRLPSEDA